MHMEASKHVSVWSFISDPLCEDPAKVILLWFAVFYKNRPSYGTENSVKI